MVTKVMKIPGNPTHFRGVFHKYVCKGFSSHRILEKKRIFGDRKSEKEAGMNRCSGCFFAGRGAIIRFPERGGEIELMKEKCLIRRSEKTGRKKSES